MAIAVMAKNLIKDYKGLKAVNGLNLSVPEGSIYGFLGPNGSGKTTTLKMLTGMTQPTGGKIEIFGKEVSFGSNANRDDIGFLPDVPGFYDWMTAREFLTFCGSLFDIKKEILIERVKNLLETVGFTSSADKKVGGFSRGMKQRLGIAQALINEPKIILLDEPVSALDPVGRKEVMDIIAGLAGKVTVFFSTHILADIERVCDRVVIIKNGKAVLEDSLENIKSNIKVRDIEIEAENISLDLLIKKLADHDWIVNISRNTKKLIVSVKDLDKARFDINSIVFNNKILIKRLNVIEPSLEDIYIKAVNG